VGVRRPRVGGGKSVDEVVEGGTRRSPQSEGAVDMHPRLRRAGDLDGSGEVVERAGVDVARLQRDDRRGIAVGEGTREALDVDASLLVRADGLRPAQARDSPGEHHRRVHRAAGEEADPRGGLQTGGRIEASPAQQRVAADHQA
jgi:hypothetical protein